MKEFDTPELRAAFVQAVAKVVEQYLGPSHELTKAFGFALATTEAAPLEAARRQLAELPAGQQNMIWLAAKSLMRQRERATAEFDKADLAPGRTLH